MSVLSDADSWGLPNTLRRSPGRAGSASVRPLRDGRAGFSLLELMVTIAVGALLLSVGVPSFMTMSRNANMVSSANGFLTDLHYTRDLAVTRNQRVVMCSSSSGAACDSADWTTGWIVFVDKDSDQAVDADETVERVSDELSGLALQSPQFAQAITFRPTGRALVANGIGYFLMCDDRGFDHARGIIIAPSGRPRVEHLASLGVSLTCPSV